MNVGLLRRRASAPVITIVETSDEWNRTPSGQYEFSRTLKLSNGESILRVMSCNNPVWAKARMDEAGLVKGATV